MTAKLSGTLLGVDLGNDAVPYNQPYTITFEFDPTNVSAYTWLAHARLIVTSTSPDITFTVTSASSTSIVVSCTAAALIALGPDVTLYCSLNQVTPTARQMFYWTVRTMPAATH